MTHQEILNAIEALPDEYEKKKQSANDLLKEERRKAITALQDKCAEIGHIYADRGINSCVICLCEKVSE